MKIIAVVLLTLSLLLPARASEDHGTLEFGTEQSIISLIATPERFDGKTVQVIGAIQIEFEGNMICLHRDDLDKSISKNCLWVEPDYRALETTVQELAKRNGQYVILRSTFSKEGTGHMDCCSGAIININRLDPWQE
jgi:hypothetical protein